MSRSARSVSPFPTRQKSLSEQFQEIEKASSENPQATQPLENPHTMEVAYGLQLSQYLKKADDWHGWKYSMRLLFVLNGVYPAMKDVFAAPSLGLVPLKKTSSSSAEATKASLSTEIDWDKFEEPRMRKLIKAARLIDSSLAPNVRTLIPGVENPQKAWKRLESWCIGTGPVQYTNVLRDRASIKSIQHRGVNI
jgi:hypothetical protein